MTKWLRLLLALLILYAISDNHFGQDNTTVQKVSIPQPSNALEIVFVVDVSYSMKDHLNYVSLLVRKIFKDFRTSAENGFYLITFADYATYKGSVEDVGTVKEKIEAEMQKTLQEFNRKEGNIRNRHYPGIPYRRQNTYPESGFWQVFALIETNFIQKRGVLLFLSDGEDSRSQTKDFEDDIETPILALENIGFSTFSFFVDTEKKYRCKERMEKIGSYGKGFYIIRKGIAAGYQDFKNQVHLLPYNSPVSYTTLEKIQKDRKKELEDEKAENEKIKLSRENAYQRIAELEITLMAAQIKLQFLEVLNHILNWNAEIYHHFCYKYRAKSQVWEWIAAIAAILLVFSGLGGFMWYRKKILPVLQNPEERLNMLWGKLIPQQNGFETIYLSDMPPGLEVHLPRDFPTLKFISYNQHGRKAIKIINSDEENWHIRFLHRSSKSLKSRHFIDDDTDEIKIFNTKDEKIFCTFKYEFLEKFSAGCKQPVWGPDEFRGRDDLVEDIKTNFQADLNCHSYLISGLGNAGKTSLIMHLFHEALGKDDMIKQKCALSFISFDRTVNDFSTYSQSVFDQLSRAGEKQKKVILIDEYDEILEQFPNQFSEFLRNNNFNNDYYYVFTGRKGIKQLEMENLRQHIPNYTFHRPLGSLETKESIWENNYNKAINFLDSMLALTGYPATALSLEVKRRIVAHASGFPSLVKEILQSLLTDWLDSYDIHPVEPRHLEDCVSRIKKRTYDFLIERVINYEKKKYPDKEEVPKGHVEISEILSGLINEEELKNESSVDIIVKILGRYRLNKKIQDVREKCVANKLELLEEMGFVAILQGKLIRMPLLIFQNEVIGEYQGTHQEY
jgi:hypothetical protein